MPRLKLKPYFAVIRPGWRVIHAMSTHSDMTVLSVLERGDSDVMRTRAAKPHKANTQGRHSLRPPPQSRKNQHPDHNRLDHAATPEKP